MEEIKFKLHYEGEFYRFRIKLDEELSKKFFDIIREFVPRNDKFYNSYYMGVVLFWRKSRLIYLFADCEGDKKIEINHCSFHRQLKESGKDFCNILMVAFSIPLPRIYRSIQE